MRQSRVRRHIQEASRDIVNGKISLRKGNFEPDHVDLRPARSSVTIKGKILMQRIWRSGIGWDDVLLERDYAKWVDYLDEVRKLSQLRIPRCYALRSSKIELHVFGDASEHAYAAVAYWRAVRPDGTVHLALVAGKSRVAPNKVMSIPRLELQAALLACRLATNIQKEHGIATERRVLWCDSKTVLRWIRSDPRAYKPFVAHRLAELDERSDRNEWRWVNSADNPADDATRADCDLERWLNGPTFLLRNEDAWPIDNDVVDERVADDEVKGESINVVCTTHTGDVIDVTRFSSWTRLRTYARVLYFIRRLRKQQQPFGADDVIDAETRLLRASQRRAFSDEMRAAAVGAATPRGSSLRALDVMLTDDWLRVGGRLRRSPTLSFDENTHHIRRPGSRRPPARRALSPASGPRQSRSSCKHHPGKILDHETQTDGEESGQRLPPVSSSTRTAGHAEDGRPPGGRLAFVKGHLRTQGGLLRATGGDRRATSREEVGGVIHVSDDARCPYGGCVLAIRRLHDNGAAKIYGKTRSTRHAI
ncbi:hypothetical protein EVAR_91266_1 [Eumeta japonica]|uniref:Uncharacterized protein n=1 Tax=Eumeta variegata TaxID=151549 RepID=A0A4C1T7Z0_EUMVA|nr:hypothetical protein EVAR_91266_1 [Eumeta japonica]